MNNSDFLGGISRWLIRIGLEEFQGRMHSDLLGDDPETVRVKDANVEEMLNIPYINRVGVPLAMDIFKPVVPKNKELPVIVMIHGGGLVMGDRSMSRSLGVCLAKRGYLVFSIEYRLVPRANVCEQLDDVCAGLNLIGEKLVEFDVDFTRIFLVAESAGAFLATYVAAMKKSKKLQDAIGYEPSRMQFKALGLMSGMYYMNRQDPVGMMLADQFFGNKRNDENFMKYTDPELPEIVGNLPPVFFITSKGDFLNQYTLMYHDALKRYGKTTHLQYYGDSALGHSFPAYYPTSEKGSDALDRMVAWFEEQAAAANRKIRQKKTDINRMEKLEARIKDGSIADQKLWKFITEMNSFSDTRLDTTALITGERRYTYRQMFEKWNSYAGVFDSLGINEKNKSRVGIFSALTAEIIFSFYGLNMTGAAVSFLCLSDILIDKYVDNTIKAEGLTDLILVDYCTTPGILKKLIQKKEALGIRNIIVLKSDPKDPFTSDTVLRSCEMVCRQLRKVKGALFMEELLDKPEAVRPGHVSSRNSELAVIVHTSGTTKGVHKPIPMSDRAVNSAILGLAGLEEYKPLMGNSVSILSFLPSNAYGVIDQIHLSLAFGCSAVVMPMGYSNANFDKAIEYYNVNILFTMGSNIEVWIAAKEAGQKTVNLESLKVVLVGGAYVSAQAKKRMNDFFKESGLSVRITNGFGLSEIGGACIIAPPDRDDDIIGYPLPGVNVRVYDETSGTFHTLADGPHEGILYLSSASLSPGRMDDQVFYELEDIDGVPYLCTYDMVRVNEDMSLSYIGRANRYYINNEGIRFDAGLVETMIAAQDGIEECAVVPVYDKMIHDTIPALYVKVLSSEEDPASAVKRALDNCFVADARFEQTNLPCMCIIADMLPHNSSGKVDVYKLTNSHMDGKRYKIEGIMGEEGLADIAMTYINAPWTPTDTYTVPEELKGDFEMFDTGNLALVIIAMTSFELITFPFFGYWDLYMKESNPFLYDILDSMGRRKITELAAIFQQITGAVSAQAGSAPGQADQGQGQVSPAGVKQAGPGGRGSGSGGMGVFINQMIRQFFAASDIDHDYEE